MDTRNLKIMSSALKILSMFHDKEESENDVFLKDLLAKLKKQAIIKLSQPEFMPARIKKIILDYLESVFAAIDYNVSNPLEAGPAQRVYSKQQKIDLLHLLESHLGIIRKNNPFKESEWDVIDIFNQARIEICEKYQIDVSLKELRNSLLDLDEAKPYVAPLLSLKQEHLNINCGDKEEKSVAFLLKDLKALPLHSVFQYGNQFIARVSERSVFQRPVKTGSDGPYSGYYIPTYDVRFKSTDIETKPDGVYIGNPRSNYGLDTCFSFLPIKSGVLNEKKPLAERSLTSYEQEDFAEAIRGLQIIQEVVVDTVKLNLPMVLIDIIISYVSYDIPLIHLATIDIDEHPMQHSALSDDVGMEIFDRMKVGEIYKKYDNTFYYVDNRQLIHSWTSQSIQKNTLEECSIDYYFTDPRIQLFFDYGPKLDDSIICKKKPWDKVGLMTLKFFDRELRKMHPKGTVLSHEEHYFRISSTVKKMTIR